MKNFLARTLSSIVIVLIISAAVLVHPALFTIVFGIIALFGVLEFNRLCKTSTFETSTNLFLSTGLFLIPLLTPYTDIRVVLSAYCVGLFITLSCGSFIKPKDFLSYAANILIPQFWIALPFALLHYIHRSNDYPSYFVLAVFLILWSNDVGAYLFGTLTSLAPKGNHKLGISISSNKSWEGLFGGITLSLLMGFLCSLRFNNYPLSIWIGLSLITAVMGVLGDLTESNFKRTLNVKDSGKLIPGHGGILDRFDSMFLTAPVVTLYMQIVNY